MAPSLANGSGHGSAGAGRAGTAAPGKGLGVATVGPLAAQPVARATATTMVASVRGDGLISSSIGLSCCVTYPLRRQRLDSPAVGRHHWKQSWSKRSF